MGVHVKKLSVLGTQDFTDQLLLEKEVSKENIDVLVTGGRRGPDLLAEHFAIEKDIPLQVILPDYRKHGRSANYLRNLRIIDHSNIVLVFWNGTSQSPFNYLSHIKKTGIPFRTIMY